MLEDPPEKALMMEELGISPHHTDHLRPPSESYTAIATAAAPYEARTATNSEDGLDLPALPALPDDIPQTQEWTEQSQDEMKKKTIRMAYVNKMVP